MPSGHTSAYRSGTLSQLKSEIYQKTGIPPDIQMFYKQKAIVDDKILKSVPNEANLNMLLAVKGGTNYCDVCYEKSDYSCEDCSGKTFCKDCCTKIHRHPDRHDHVPQLLDVSENPQKASCNEESQLDYDIMADSQDDETDKLFRDSMMLATLAERFDSTQFKVSKKNNLECTWWPRYFSSSAYRKWKKSML